MRRGLAGVRHGQPCPVRYVVDHDTILLLGEDPVVHPVIHIIDDDYASRDGLQTFLESAGYKSACYESAETFIAVADSICGCAIIDLRMPRINGLELQRMLRDKRDDIGVIFISGHGTVSAAARALRGGAVDFLTKPVDPETLLDRIKEILAQYNAYQNAQAELAVIRDRLTQLTAREHQVLEAVVAGNSSKQIAHQLNISYRTVEVHRVRVMRKMGADSIAGLVRQSIRINAADWRQLFRRAPRSSRWLNNDCMLHPE